MTQPREEAILIAYGDIRMPDGELVRGRAILNSLLGSHYWLSSRAPKRWIVGQRVLFYQASTGFTAAARLVNVEPSRAVDWQLPGRLHKFPHKMILDDVQIFATPVEAKPLLIKLSFVINKKHWGHAFRYLPRMIPASDAITVLAKAGARTT